MLTLICAGLSTGSRWSFSNRCLKQLSVPAGKEQQFLIASVIKKKTPCANTSKKIEQCSVEKITAVPHAFTRHKVNFCVIPWKCSFCYSYKISLNLSNFQQPQNRKRSTQAKSLLFIALNILPIIIWESNVKFLTLFLFAFCISSP